MFEKIKEIIKNHRAIEKSANLKAANNDLLISARQGSCLGVKKALAQGANINFGNGQQNVLFNVISSANLDCIKLVLDSKINLDFKADANLSAIQWAIASNANIDVLNLLLDYPFNHNIQDIDGNTNVHYASTNIDLLKKIITNGGKLDIKNNEGRTPFNYQFLSPNLPQRIQLCEIYIKNDCDIFEKNNFGQSSFILGIMSGKVEKQKEVIDYFCSLITNKEYFDKALQQTNLLQDSENKQYVLSRLNAFIVNSNLEKELILKPGKDKKLKI